MKTVSQFALMNDLSRERVRTFCKQGRIAGAMRIGALWVIPDDAELPARKVGRPRKTIDILPADSREIKTRKQKKYLASCKSPEQNLSFASPFANAKIEIEPW